MILFDFVCFYFNLAFLRVILKQLSLKILLAILKDKIMAVFLVHKLHTVLHSLYQSGSVFTHLWRGV